MSELTREQIEDWRKWGTPQLVPAGVTAFNELCDMALRSLVPSATGATDAEVDEFVRVARTFSDEHYQNSLVAELRRAYHAQEETVIGHARYEYVRKLNPREFAALYDEALHGDRFDDLVDRYRDAGGRQE